MAYTAPKTWVTGEVVDAAGLNTYLRDNDLWVLTDSPAVRAYRSTSQSISNNVGAAAALDSERFDNANIHSTTSNTARLTVPAGGGGKCLIGAAWDWAANASGVRQGYVMLNGSTLIASDVRGATSSLGADGAIATVYSLAATDYVELFVYQNSGGSLNLTTNPNFSPEFWLFWFRT